MDSDADVKKVNPSMLPLSQYVSDEEREIL